MHYLLKGHATFSYNITLPSIQFPVTMLESTYLGGDEESMKSLISNLISIANNTYNGRFQLQHLSMTDKLPPGIYQYVSIEIFLRTSLCFAINSLFPYMLNKLLLPAAKPTGLVEASFLTGLCLLQVPNNEGKKV